MSMLIVKDLQGYRLAELDDNEPFDGVMFHLKNGQLVGEDFGFIPDITNIRNLRDGVKLNKMDDLFCVEEEDNELYRKLNLCGFGVDSDLRIHRRIGKPFTAVKSTQIGAILSAHLHWCEEKKLNPEQYPINLVWHEDKVGILLKVPLPPDAPVQGEALVGMAVPEAPEAEGEILLHKDDLGTVRIALKFSDYYMMVDCYHPATKIVTLKVYKYMSGTFEPTEATEVSLVTADKKRFITEHGIYKKDASYLEISIDDFFKEEGK